MSHPITHLFRVSLREFLAAILFLCVALAGFMAASSLIAGLFAFVAAILGIFMLMRACFERGHGRAFAIGFVVAAFGYWIMVNLVEPTLNIYLRWGNEATADRDWGTSGVVYALHNLSSKQEVLDQASGEWIDQDSSRGIEIINNPPKPTGTLRFYGLQTRSRPEFTLHLRVAKSLLFLFFGYIGGKAATFAFDRRRAIESSSGDA